MCIWAGSRCIHTLFRGLATGLFDLYPVQGILITVYMDFSSFPLSRRNTRHKISISPLLFYHLYCSVWLEWASNPRPVLSARLTSKRSAFRVRRALVQIPACRLAGIAWFLSVLASNFWDGISNYTTTAAFTTIPFPYQLLHHSTLIV